MRVLLPPSEAKTHGGRGRPIGDRSSPGPLAVARGRVLAALDELLRGSDTRAAESLRLPVGVAAAALAADRAVLGSPTRPALRRYDGVLYTGLDYAALAPGAQRVAARHAMIFSGLWGVVRGDDPVPDYRVPAQARLPRLGVAGRFWRTVLTRELPALLGNELIVDLRSSDYAAMWRPPAQSTRPVVTVRVLSPLPRGGLGVVSHPSKLAKGRLAAALFTRMSEGGTIDSARDVIDTWRALGGRAEATATGAVTLHSA